MMPTLWDDRPPMGRCGVAGRDFNLTAPKNPLIATSSPCGVWEGFLSANFRRV
jgi:hypothetical protein